MSKKNEKQTNKTLSQNMNDRIDVDMESLRQQHVMVATPCYGGMIGEPYLKAMTGLAILFKHYGLNFTLATLSNESLVTRARNTLTAMFLENSAYTHMMFIDADIGFTPQDVVKMLHRDKDIVTGAYPKKTINWPAIHGVAMDQKPSDPLELAKFQASYALNIKRDHMDSQEIPLVKGLIPVLDAGTGFMMIKRSVIDKMVKEFPETRYNNDLNTDPKLQPYFYALFDTMIEPDTKRYLSEDYTFCRRWQKMGGEIWMDPSVNLDHYGSYQFQGNIAEQFTLVKKED
tara:strand:- start:1269 stop:2129 length:861 start_codon:yes stop_codon:yes gene_type:complete